MKRFGPLALLVMVLAAGCARVPEAQVESAREAVEAARAAGAPEYASDAWNRAQKAMEALDAELSAQSGKSALFRSYRRARALAAEAAQAANQALSAAEAKKSQLQSDVTAMIADLRGRLQSARTQLSRVPRTAPLNFASAGSRLDTAGRQLDQAQGGLEGGRYDSAMASAADARDNITTVLRMIEQATGVAPARKR